MLIDRNIENYIIHLDTSVKEGFKKISATKGRILFCVDHHNHLKGVITNGDLVNWLISCGDKANLNNPIKKVMNTNYRYHKNGESLDNIYNLLDKFLFIPIVDKNHHLTGVAKHRTLKDNFLIINKKRVSENDPVFIIAEIGNNHNGSLERSKRLIDQAAKAGADCVKFQMRDMQQLYKKSEKEINADESLGSQYITDLLYRFQLKNEDMFKAFDYCKKSGVIPLCTPWDNKSLKILENYGMPAYKVASADLTNHELINKLILTGKPLIVSTGMAKENEIIETVELLRSNGAQYALLHCNSTYPPPFKDIHLNYLERLKEIGKTLVGYSGHELDIFIPIAAVSKGATIIEKHFTEDRSLEGNDHKISLLPREFARMVEGIRQVTEATKYLTEKSMSQGEIINRVNLAKSLFAKSDIKKGELIEEKNIGIKSPGHGLQPNHKNKLIGKESKRSMKAGDVFYESDLQNFTPVKPRNYKFKRPWGIPVRYHDYKNLANKTNLDLLEFHLSYKDLELDIKNYFNEHFDLNIVVHSPELFANDHILDLCASDNNYRKHSVDELQRVINITRELGAYFKNSSEINIVTNVGGFTMSKELSKDKKRQKIKNLIKSINQLDTKGVNILPQTMPPYPWHFGGRRFHNIFVDAEEIVDFCKKNNFKICLDISHSKLAMNHRKESFTNFLEKVGKYVSHIHIADAKGLDGEGLQIGEGEIDFISCERILEKLAPNASMIPEIWQGHENEGEGFWKALNKLENFFNNK